MKRCEAGLKYGIVRTGRQQHAYATDPLVLLCMCNERNRSCAA